MIIKTRTEPTELLILRTLNYRMNLPEKLKQYYLNVKKGYEGELLFDSLTEKLSCDCLILNDLLLKTNNNTFQIDSLLILPDSIYLFEVKNYDGDFYYKEERIYKNPQTEVLNPFTQLNRTESLLRQLLQILGFSFSINASVVFINPEFTLYQAPLNKPFIYPTQINRYLKQLDTNSLKLSNKHRNLADKLISLHIKHAMYNQLPTYQYDQLQKGIMCKTCNSFLVSIKGKKCICEHCGNDEIISTAVMRAVREFMLLFPNEKITTNVIYDWCKEVLTKRRIREILKNNFQISGVNQWTYYIK